MPSNKQLHWGRSTVETACPLDCPDACSLAVTVENGRLVSIDGSPRHGVTGGFICAKVRRFGDRVYGESRITAPAIREGRKGEGRFTRVSWDEALTRIADRIREVCDEFGAEAILPFCYGGSNGLLTQDTADADLFRRLGTSRLARTVCAAPTGAASLAMYGKMPGVGYADYAQARLIVIWGANPSASGIHLMPFIHDARRNGAVLVVIDPRRTQLARLADLHLPVRPGTDLVVALAVHRHLFETDRADLAFLRGHTTGFERLREAASEWTFERAAATSGAEAGDIERFADLYTEASPAVIRCGWGLERNRNGVDAALAILALPAVAGKFGVRGGGYTMSNSGGWPFTSAVWTAPEPQTRIINMNRLGRVLLGEDALSPPIKLLFVYNANPAATMPDQNRVLRGLQREDLFTVVFDQVMTDTAQLADVVLPATTFLETYDLVRGYGAASLQIARPVIDAVGEARPNGEVFSDLARRLGLRDDEPETEAETLIRVLAAMPEETREALLAGEVAAPPGGFTPVQFVDVFPRTPDGKVHLYPESIAGAARNGLYVFRPDPATVEYPLALISPASEKTVSSTLGELRNGLAALYIHRDDATVRGIEDGDPVRVWNELGEVQCIARVGEEIVRGTVSLPKGLWRKSTMNLSTANALAPDAVTEIAGGACFNDARVQVARIVQASFERHDVSLWVPSGPGHTVN